MSQFAKTSFPMNIVIEDAKQTEDLLIAEQAFMSVFSMPETD